MTRKPLLPLLLPAIVAVILLAWAVWVTWTSFRAGALPVVGWQTEHRHLFGTLWLAAFLCILLPVYFFGISLGLTSLIESDQATPQRPSVCWSVACGMTIVEVLITFTARLAVTAWFPTEMHPPFQHLQGGWWPGLISTAVLALLLTLFYRIMRRIAR